MKVIKASSVVAGTDGYICYLTRKEALAVCSLTGSCIGNGEARTATNSVFNALNSHGVDCSSIIGNAVINITGDIE